MEILISQRVPKGTIIRAEQKLREKKEQVSEWKSEAKKSAPWLGIGERPRRENKNITK